jgi:hypothetical protein
MRRTHENVSFICSLVASPALTSVLAALPPVEMLQPRWTGHIHNDGRRLGVVSAQVFVHVAEVAAIAVAQPAAKRRVFTEPRGGRHRCYYRPDMPSRQATLAGAVLALGVLALILALRVVPAPWIGWFR